VLVALMTLVITFLLVRRRITNEAANTRQRIPEITAALTRRT